MSRIEIIAKQIRKGKRGKGERGKRGKGEKGKREGGNWKVYCF
jgi:hypothetical protein